MSINNIGLALYIIILLIYFVGLRTSLTMINNSIEINTNRLRKIIDIMENFKMCYFTTWNFLIQIIFLSVTILNGINRNVLDITHNARINTFLNNFRTYIFSSIVFPCSWLVFFFFWSLFIYDRELIFPKEMDTFFPLYLNHILHTVILLPLAIELCLPKHHNLNITFKNALIGFTCYMIIYEIMYIAIYFNYGIWLYQIDYKITWNQRTLYVSAIYGAGSLFCFIGVQLQNWRKICPVANSKMQ